MLYFFLCLNTEKCSSENMVMQRDDDIVSAVKKDRAEEDTEEEDEEGGEEYSKVSIPTVSDALEAIRVVNLFYESRGGSSEIVTICLGYCGSAYFGYNDIRL
jgi:hypothetical protein